MAIFTRFALTRKGQELIAKAQAGRATINFTKFGTGSGLWRADEDLEYATELKEPRQEFSFSDISIPAGNGSTVVVTVNITNEELVQLYYLNEAAIFADDPEVGEIVYAILASEEQTTYVPAYNGVGISNIVQRINLEVANANTVTINMDGAHVSAAEYTAFRNAVNSILAGLMGGSAGEYLTKLTNEANAYGWTSPPVVTKTYAEFPKTGRTDSVYIDVNTSEIYVWTLYEGKMQYFKLPLGAEASATLQAQITANRNAIVAIQAKLAETNITVPKVNWEAGAALDGTVKYSQTITVANMTDSMDVEVWPRLIATTGSGIVAEKKALSLFFGKGVATGQNGSVLLECYGRKPDANFGLTLKGVSSS